MNTLGQRIFEKRTELGLTMEQLAEKVGVTKSTVNKWEKGYIKNLKADVLYSLSNIFNVSPFWLLGYNDDDKRNHYILSITETATMMQEIKSLEQLDYMAKAILEMEQKNKE